MKMKNYLKQVIAMARNTSKANNACAVDAVEIESKAFKTNIEELLERYEMALFFDFDNKSKLDRYLDIFCNYASGGDKALYQPLFDKMDVVDSNGNILKSNASVHDVLVKYTGRLVQKKTEYGTAVFTAVGALGECIDGGCILAEIVNKIPEWVFTDENPFFNSTFYADMQKVEGLELSEETISKASDGFKAIKKALKRDMTHNLFKPAEHKRVPVSKFRKEFEKTIGDWINKSISIANTQVLESRQRREEQKKQFSVSFDETEKKYIITGLNSDYRRIIRDLAKFLDTVNIEDKKVRVEYYDRITTLFVECGGKIQGKELLAKIKQELTSAETAETAE